MLEAIHATVIAPNKAFHEMQAFGRAIKESTSKIVDMDLRGDLRSSIKECCDYLMPEDPRHGFIAQRLSGADAQRLFEAHPQTVSNALVVQNSPPGSIHGFHRPSVS